MKGGLEGNEGARKRRIKKMARVGDCIRAAWLRNSLATMLYMHKKDRSRKKESYEMGCKKELETDRKVRAVDKI